MTWWNPHNFEQKKPYLERRMALLRSVRAWFDGQGFFEVETPALQVCPVMDTHVHAIKADVRGIDLQHDRTLYLHTSPEFAMKKLLVAGVPKLYQICHVFRDAEGSRLHAPEFTMLEWYRAGATYRDIMQDCEDMLRFCSAALGVAELKFGDHVCNVFAPWQIISVVDAFRDYAGIDLGKYLDNASSFNVAVAACGIRTAPDDRWDDLFFRVMAEKIEPHLGVGAPTILHDYPVSMASLARRNPADPRFAQRFELYVCGIELANAFGELTDPVEQRARFKQEMIQKQDIYGESYPPDEDFFKALEHGMPESGGIAMGFDRLAMLFSGAEKIEQVLWTGKV